MDGYLEHVSEDEFNCNQKAGGSFDKDDSFPHDQEKVFLCQDHQITLF